MDILIPKRWLPDDRAQPTFFLAGPIRGGADWQHRMSLALHRAAGESLITIVCPCRWTERHPLAPHFIDAPERHSVPQLDWERHYLELAGTGNGRGCVVFWLPAESEEAPHPGPEPYAMNTRGELGEWRWRVKSEHARVVIGAEPGFFGLSEIRRNYSLALGYDFPIYSTMEETARAAVAL